MTHFRGLGIFSESQSLTHSLAEFQAALEHRERTFQERGPEHMELGAASSG